MILWLWNTVELFDEKRLRISRIFSKIWTFDQGDAEKYHLNFADQFYINSIETCTEVHKNIGGGGIFFIGADKGRSDILRKVMNICRDSNILYDFYLLRDSNLTYDDDIEKIVIDERRDYEFVLNHISKSDILLDLVREGQKGLTVRVLEALYYGKKVITNNTSIIANDLYSSGNIYVLDNEDYSISTFLQQEIKPYPKKLLIKHSAEVWLNTIIYNYE